MSQQGAPGVRTWTDADSALWITADIIRQLNQGVAPRQRVYTMFPLEESEQAFVIGQIRVDSYQAVGDGSYTHTDGPGFIGWGKYAAGAGLALAALNAVGNSARRWSAASDAQVMWRPAMAGTVTVSSHGFYLQDQTDILPWTWDDISLMRLEGFHVVVMHGDSENGPIMFRLMSDWAELIFLLWAAKRNRNHPHAQGLAWLPPNWAPWAAAQGYPLPELAPRHKPQPIEPQPTE